MVENWVFSRTKSFVQKPDAVCVRPFQDVSFDQRPVARRKQWASIWRGSNCPIDLGPQSTQLRQRAIQQARAIEPLPLCHVKRLIKSMPVKAGGADGLSVSFLKALPEAGVRELVGQFAAWEATGSLPGQLTVSLITMLAKDAEIERPIALCSVL